MVKYYFKIFRRNFAKNKTHFLLNLLGLTLGITCFLLALLFVFYENNYDSYVQHKDRIARIVTTVSSGGKVTNTALSNGFLTAALPAAFPEVAGMVRFLPFDTRVALRVKTKGDDISLENIYYADSSAFRIFSYPLIEGDRRSCLSNPNSIVLSKKIVKKIFGTTAVVNRTVLLNNKPLKVTGVVEDLPGNSDLVFDGLVSMNTIKPEEVDWVYTYVLFNTTTARDSFQTKLDKFTKEKINPEVAKEADLTFRYKLEPMGSIHFSNNSVYDTPKGDRRMVNIFLITGILILVIACTNSINMMVVRSFSRATETTIQKIYGASRRALITQQVIESVAVGVIATIFAFLLIGWLLPGYAIAIDRKLSASDLFNKRILASVLAALVTLGVSGAIYAAFYLQKIQLADILRSGTSRGYKMKWISRLMLGFQFFISMGMMVAALVVHRQVTWLNEAPLGFNPANVLVVDLPQGEGVMSGDKYLKNSLRTAPGAVLTSLCGVKSLPGGFTDISVYEYRENGIKVKKTVDVITADADYFKVLQVPIINGSNFYDSRDSGAKKIHVIVTNLMAKKAGWDHPLAERVRLEEEGEEPVDVIGVVPDFHFSSLHNPVEPIIISQQSDDPAYLLIRAEPSGTAAVIAAVQKEWKKAFPGLPVYYYFLDQHLQQQYRGEKDLLSLLLTLTSLIIVISCIGLVAYTSFVMRIASVDIAIRRIIGASLRNIFSLFNRQFVLLLVIAFLAALPVAWYLLHLWLNQFSYHIDLKPADFIVALITISAIVTSVVLYYSWRCVRINPARIIREK